MQTTTDTKYEIVKNSKEWMMKYQSSVENLIRLRKEIHIKIVDSILSAWVSGLYWLLVLGGEARLIKN